MMREEKGITLVALIITIIVMLILVAVTISIAVNGGLFENAKTARDETIRAQAKEAVTLAKAEAIADYYANGTVPSETGSEPEFKGMVEGYLETEGEDAYTVSCTGSNGNYTVTVSKANTNISVTVPANISFMFTSSSSASAAPAAASDNP